MVTTLHSNVAAISGTSVATRWMTSAVQIYSFTYLFLTFVAPDPKRWQNRIDLFIYLFVVYNPRQHMILREDQNWIDLFIHLFFPITTAE